MLKKIFLGLILLALLAAVSYLKTQRESQHLKSSYEEGNQVGSVEAMALREHADSLGKELETNKARLEDSLRGKEAQYELTVDSLNYLIDEQNQAITDLKKKATAAKAPATKSGSTQLSRHEDIYKFYKTRYTALPSDLSDYEKRIALNEIREETAKKFSISLDELKKIRDEYHLTY